MDKRKPSEAATPEGSMSWGGGTGVLGGYYSLSYLGSIPSRSTNPQCSIKIGELHE